ncbi:MAG TPA: hypothetical protein VFP92_03615 [Rhodanobacteraceae bacterium]|nr:hypothetical protein [Rhodanobacteraceae bacterium]
MPPIRTAIEEMPLAGRLLEGLRYPLRGGALAACVALGLCHYAVLLPSIIGLLAALVVWIATWRYAIDCMVLTADGYDDPPEVKLEGRAGNPRGILALHVFVILACLAIAAGAPAYLWLALVIAALLLPAMGMSLAFDGDLMVALNPATWLKIVTRFGVVYGIPVIANAALAGLIWVSREGIGQLPLLLSLPIFGFVCTYLIVLDFHWMGTLVWHCRERLGMRPEASDLAEATGHGADARLLAECEALALDDPEEAAIRLRDRIRENLAPAAVHNRFRSSLRRLDRNDLLISHGQTWIAQLCATGDERRALGVVQECREIDPRFLPDDPANTAKLAKAAARIGMQELAWFLATGFVRRWPRHRVAPALKRLAASRAGAP